MLPFFPVLRIHDILVWIRIRIWIRGSMPLTNGSESGSGSCYFRHWPSRCQQKTNFLIFFCCFLLFKGTFTSFFKDKKLKESQNRRNQGFSCYFWMMTKGSIPQTGSGSATLLPSLFSHTLLTEESAALGLPDFPVENLAACLHIMSQGCPLHLL
jgi:hypothetical protein